MVTKENKPKQACRQAGYLSDIIDKEDFMLAYKPLVDRDKEIDFAEFHRGQAYGLEQGDQLEKLNLAKKLLAKQFAPQIIADMVELDIATVEAL